MVRVVKVDAPKTVREMFDMLAEYDGQCSLLEFLERSKWEERSVYQIYDTFLDRMPESISTVQNQSKLERLALASNALLSVEFQHRSVELLLKAFPEKRRLIHIHIPKSAGTDLRDALISRFPQIHFNHTLREFIGPQELVAHLAETSRRFRTHSEILITGHIPIKWFVDRRLLRSTDRIFSIFRRPEATAISAVNYRLRRISEDPKCSASDTRSWANKLGVERFADELSQDKLHDIGLKMLESDVIMRDCLATEILGQGTADSALDYIVRTNIELVPIEKYNEWVKETWGFELETRANASQNILLYSDLTDKYIARIQNFWREDIILYDKLISCFNKIGGNRIFGGNLIEI